ncbi:MAG: UDP-N-acetylmuramoyl-tripeptide--D-alanyl-D-alanine ligase [Thermoleophilia bacterium]
MIPLSLAEVAELCPGSTLLPRGVADRVTGVDIDSRRIEPGHLFVAVGRGREFVEEALARGAAAALLAPDPQAALAAIAGAVRERARAKVVAITGSTGKTSTKDILAAICRARARTVAAPASFNNELGVPLTLCRIEPDTEVCIVEMAMRGHGQIASLCEIARPEVGVVTNVGPAHLELVGSIEGVIKAKSELIAALPKGGVAIVPDGFPVSRDDVRVIRVGDPEARVDGDVTRLHFRGREIELSFSARHQARNALCALHAAHALGIEPEKRVEVSFSPWRGEERPLPGGGLLLNDCWNANPVSMRAALEHLAERARGRRLVCVLGDMAELGPAAADYHRQAGALAASLGVAALVAVGSLARFYLEGARGVPLRRRVRTAEEAAEALQALLQPGDCVLVKGSRSVGLERVAEAVATVAI